MKLHDIVELRESIKDAYNLDSINKEFESIIDNLLIIQSKCNEDYAYKIGRALQAIRHVHSNLTLPMLQFNDINQVISGDLQEATEKFRLENYQDELNYARPEKIREIRNLYIPEGVGEIINGTIGLYVDWRYPGLEIGCRDGEFTKHLVGCDPLYITDVHQEFLDSTMNSHTAEYQRRLRPYLIQNSDMSKLPVGQFGFVFSWNFFNYLSLDSMNKYLTQCFELMRPGGVIMFSYNNADLASPAAYADSYFMSYAPKSELIPLCEKIGFEVISTTDIEPAISWAELRKPGDLKLVKAHQVLGEIKWVNP